MFTIRRNPYAETQRTKYPWDQLRPYDSFVYPQLITCLEDEMKVRSKLYGSAKSWADRRQLPWKFTTEKVTECGGTFIKIWRIS